MIRLSMLLVALAAVALVAGLLSGGLELIWLSIGLCLLAGLLLSVGVLRLRQRAQRDERVPPPWSSGPERSDQPPGSAGRGRGAEPFP